MTDYHYVRDGILAPLPSAEADAALRKAAQRVYSDHLAGYEPSIGAMGELFRALHEANIAALSRPATPPLDVELREAMRVYESGHKALHYRGTIDCPICAAIQAAPLAIPTPEPDAYERLYPEDEERYTRYRRRRSEPSLSIPPEPEG